MLLWLACVSSPDYEVTSAQLATDEQGQTVVVTTVERTDPPAPDGAACVEPVRDEAACLAHGQAMLYAGDYAAMEDAWYTQCQRGYAPACGELAYQYANPYVQPPHRAERAVEVLNRACELHAAPISCGLVADAYQAGTLGFPVDAAKSDSFRKQACADGHYHSCPH